MKMTQKMIRSYLNVPGAVNCTKWGIEEFNAARANEGHFDDVARSYGVYGTNGLVMQGQNTGTFYVVPSRSSALFLFPW